MKDNGKQPRKARLTGKSLGRPEGISGEETRERLLEVGASLFACEGYHGVTLSQIAGAAGISAPAIYNHFKSKDDLFMETACNLFDEIQDTFAQSAAVPGSWHTKLTQVLSSCEELYREDAVLQRFGVVFEVEAARDPDRFEHVREKQRAIDNVFQSIIQHAVQSGDLPSSLDVRVTGNLLASLIMGGISSRTLTSPTKRDHKNLIASFKTLLGIPDTQVTSNVTKLAKKTA